MGIPPLRDIIKLTNQAWVWHAGKWQLHQGFNTVVMELYLKDKMDCPAIPVIKPDDIIDAPVR